ncbi:MAG: hypothetical protein ACAH80_07515 [Alphaproteobacteria bacterium]
MDRFDRLHMLDEYKRQNEIRQGDITAVGGLLDGAATQKMSDFLTQRCCISRLQAGDVLDTITNLAGQQGADPIQVLRESLAGHVSKPFLAHTANLKEAEGILKTAIKDVNELISASPKDPEGAVITATAVKRGGPKQG